MKELRKLQSSTFDTLTRKKFIEDQNTIMELSGRLQELQNQVNCINVLKDFQDAESVRSWKFTRYQSTWIATQRRAARYLRYIWYIRKCFCKSTDFLISPVSSGIKFYMEENY